MSSTEGTEAVALVGAKAGRGAARRTRRLAVSIGAGQFTASSSSVVQLFIVFLTSKELCPVF
jgi:hypothetical protein